MRRFFRRVSGSLSNLNGWRQTESNKCVRFQLRSARSAYAIGLGAAMTDTARDADEALFVIDSDVAAEGL